MWAKPIVIYIQYMPNSYFKVLKPLVDTVHTVHSYLIKVSTDAHINTAFSAYL